MVSDWGAVRDRVKGVLAGMDLEMPGSGGANDRQIIEAVQSGELDEEVLDTTVERILNIVLRYTENRKEEKFDREKDHKKAEEIAEKCIVLLKNDAVGEKQGGTGEKVLPLSREEKIAMIGGFAARPRYQGGGSSHINAHEVISALSLKDAYGDIAYAEGFPADEDRYDERLAEEAVKTAETADKILVFAGLPDSFESESYDRGHMRLPDCQNRVIEKLCSLGKPVVVVLHNGSPVEMPWADRVDGIIELYLGGEGVAEAAMNVLYGRVNPSGKLAETFPLRLEDNPSFLNFPGKDKHVRYAEGVFVGYRYYDTRKADVLFPFGYGLSYTSFLYDNLRIGKPAPDVSELKQGGTVNVSVDVKNTGGTAGREIVQLYVSDLTGAAERPVQELKGFESVFLEPGETKTVVMELDYRSFAWYDAEQKDWYAADGAYEIRVGSSSRDIRLTSEVLLTGAKKKFPVIDANVMIGDLMECRETAPFVKEELMPYIAEFIGTASLEEMDEMERKMVHYMPLSSLRSFSAMDNEKVSEYVKELREMTGQAERKK